MRFYTTTMIAAALAASTANAKVSKEEGLYLAYLASEGKSYPTRAEFAMRFQNWKATDDFIRNHPPTSFKLSHNSFSDLSATEKSHRLARKQSLSIAKASPTKESAPLTSSASSRLPPKDCLDPKCKICSKSKTTCFKCR